MRTSDELMLVITRANIIDGLSLVSLDHYPQAAMTVDLELGSETTTWLSPLFKDDEFAAFNLQDPSSPERTLYFIEAGNLLSL